MQEEEKLFNRMQEGDWSAFNSFFECYAEQLYHYALGFVKHREEAEDIVQDVFIYLWTNRDKIAYTGSVYAYLCRAVKNSCIDYKLHEKVEERYRREMAVLAPEDAGEEDDFEELYARLQAVMETLPPKCREIFVLGCVESMSYKEIAEQLNISVNTVKTQMKSAYKKIKGEFGNKNEKFMMILCYPHFVEDE
ncbi:RNA polymerase sigma factor [Butyricimonas synergistica]|uniref:RNA polymerase sigma factor n=1 Tax=Butyricimonas synergistica TaxID=544644 RepID=UPI0005911736|nr:RNA polymerase sigma-70 factor [Butyricimonas synergistica]